MASSLIKIFRFKRRKDLDDDTTNHSSQKEKCSTLRCCSPMPTLRADKEAIYISGVSWSRPSAPYAVITAPKKSKQTRSCPGGVCAPQWTSTFKKNSASNSKNGNCCPKDKNCEVEVKTSEYGSADPSPTDCSQSVITPVPDSDHDSDYIAQIAKYETEIKKLRKRIKEERNYFKDQIITAQREQDRMRHFVDKASRAVMQAQKAIDHERKKNQSLRKELHESDIIIIELQNQLKNYRSRNGERVDSMCCAACRSAVEGAGESLCALTHSNANLYDDMSSVSNIDNDLCGTNQAINQIEKRSCNASTRSPMKRSFSDSELPSMLVTAEVETISEECLTSPIHLPTRGELLSGSLDGTSFSSDDDSVNIHLIGKQLRRRGDVVRFNPPRRSIKHSTYRRFSQKERSALAEFDYLKELSTDASAIATNSDFSSPENRFSDKASDGASNNLDQKRFMSD